MSKPPPLPDSPNPPNLKPKKKKNTWIIVVAILAGIGFMALTLIGVLLAIAVPALQAAKKEAQRAMAQRAVVATDEAVSRFETVNGRLPTSWAEITDYLTVNGKKADSAQEFMSRAKLPQAKLQIRGIERAERTEITFPNGRVVGLPQTNQKKGEGAQKNHVPTPEMAVGMNLKTDPKKWRMAGPPEGNEKFISSEVLPSGEDIGNWRELSTSIVVFNANLAKYEEAWASSLQETGATILERKPMGDGSLWIKYRSAEENGMWRFFQGPDGVYGISYQTKPDQEDQARVDIWREILSGAFLTPNPAAQGKRN